MVVERKSAVNPSENNYNDLIDLIYSHGDGGQPDVIQEHNHAPTQVFSEPAAIPFVTVSDDDG